MATLLIGAANEGTDYFRGENEAKDKNQGKIFDQRSVEPGTSQNGWQARRRTALAPETSRRFALIPPGLTTL